MHTTHPENKGVTLSVDILDPVYCVVLVMGAMKEYVWNSENSLNLFKPLEQELAIFFLMGHIVNIFIFTGSTISVITTQLRCCSSHRQYINK